jgi:hypothetical protein
VCIVVVLAILLLPAFGAVIGYGVWGVAGAWLCALVGLVLVLVVAGIPTGLFLMGEKKKFDREESDDPYAGKR